MVIVYFILPDFICMHLGTRCVHFHLVIFFQFCHRTPLMSPRLLWSIKHRLRNNELATWRDFISLFLCCWAAPKGMGLAVLSPCSIQDGQWEGVYTNLWLSQIALSSAKFYCCTEWKQWWCVVTADCLTYMAVPMRECLPALILLGVFAMNFLHTNSFTRILSRYIEKRNCCLSVETLLMVKLWKG